DGMYFSYEYIPLDSWIHFQNDSISDFIIETFNYMFVIAFQMSIPIVGCLFLVEVALGIIARTVPQLNVFVVGLPIKIFVSFVVIFFFIRLYIVLVKALFQTIFCVIRQFMLLFGGGYVWG